MMMMMMMTVHFSFTCFSLCTRSGQRQAGDQPVGGAPEESSSDTCRLKRENGRLQEQLKSREELNATLRSELDLHRSIMAQTSLQYQEQHLSHTETQAKAQKTDACRQTKTCADAPTNTGRSVSWV